MRYYKAPLQHVIISYMLANKGHKKKIQRSHSCVKLQSSANTIALTSRQKHLCLLYMLILGVPMQEVVQDSGSRRMLSVHICGNPKQDSTEPMATPNGDSLHANASPAAAKGKPVPHL